MNEPLIPENDNPISSRIHSKKTGLIITFAVILTLLAVLAMGLKKVQAGPLSTGPAPISPLSNSMAAPLH